MLVASFEVRHDHTLDPGSRDFAVAYRRASSVDRSTSDLASGLTLVARPTGSPAPDDVRAERSRAACVGANGAATLLDDVLPAIQLLPVDVALHVAAQRRYRASLRSAISFVDQVSIAVIERHNITIALALDPDPLQSGGIA